MTDLLDAVDALTKPRVTHIDRSKNGIKCVGETITHESLLEWLDTAVAGAVGIGGSKALASQRNPIDADALYKFVLIESQIKDWARILKSEIVKEDPGATLRKWFVAFQSAPFDEAAEAFYTKKLWSWVKQIEAKLEPRETADFPNPCPNCEATTWWNPSTGEEYLRPLQAEYLQDSDPIETGTASCRACGKQWKVGELIEVLDTRVQA